MPLKEYPDSVQIDLRAWPYSNNSMEAKAYYRSGSYHSGKKERPLIR